MNNIKSSARRFNIFDAAVLLLIAVGIFFTVRAVRGSAQKNMTLNVSGVMRIDYVASNEAAAIAVGSVLTDADGNVFGTVTAVDAKPYTDTLFNYETDRFSQSSVTGKYTLDVSFDAACLLRDGRYVTRAGQRILCAGKTADVRIPFSYGEVTIIKVREKEIDEDEA